jgi:hypothetical protein
VADRYVQRLDALGLSIERNTEAVPADGAWYLLRNGDVIGRYRSRKAAQEAWRQIIDESGWTPPKTAHRTTEEMLAAERAARDRDARNEYWHSGRRHAW